MIIGGQQLGNTRWLAGHLQNAADNEVIEHVETTGTIATDIDGALAEFDAITAGTRATEGVYAAFINPPEPLTRRQYARALAHMEKRLGLTGQPRIVVFHVKDGREHCHVVWLRINVREMKAIHLSHDKQKLRRCARELAAEFGLELPANLANDRGIARFDDPPQPSRAEKAMEAASGLSREERRRDITDCYRRADSASAFVNALEAAGYLLARGDRRAYVVVDIAGDVHSLARQIDGAKTKDVKKKLEGLTLSLLPPVDRARVLMLQRDAARQDARRASESRRAVANAEHERLSAVQRKRRAALDLLWQKMKIRHMHERKVLLAHVKAEREHRIARRHFQVVGLALYLKKIAVIRQLIEYYLKRRKKKMDEQHRVLIEALRRRHDNEAAELRRRYAALERLERREFTSFEQKFGEAERADDQRRIDIENVVITYEAVYDLSERSPSFPLGRTDPAFIDLSERIAELEAEILALAQLGAGNTAVLTSLHANISGDVLWTDFRQNAVEIARRVTPNVTFTDDPKASDGPRPSDSEAQPSRPGAP